MWPAEFDELVAQLAVQLSGLPVSVERGDVTFGHSRQAFQDLAHDAPGRRR